VSVHAFVLRPFLAIAALAAALATALLMVDGCNWSRGFPAAAAAAADAAVAAAAFMLALPSSRFSRCSASSLI
jgi:hypothetical protein